MTVAHGAFAVPPVLAAVRLNLVAATAVRTVRDEPLQPVQGGPVDGRTRLRLSQVPIVLNVCGGRSTFILTTADPRYRTPAFIGNGSFSLVSSPLGTAPALSFAAGVYDHASGDVPRIDISSSLVRRRAPCRR